MASTQKESALGVAGTQAGAAKYVADVGKEQAFGTQDRINTGAVQLEKTRAEMDERRQSRASARAKALAFSF